MKWYEDVVDQSEEIKYFYPKDFKANVWGTKEDFSLAIAMMRKQIQGKDEECHTYKKNSRHFGGHCILHSVFLETSEFYSHYNHDTREITWHMLLLILYITIVITLYFPEI